MEGLGRGKLAALGALWLLLAVAVLAGGPFAGRAAEDDEGGGKAAPPEEKPQILAENEIASVTGDLFFLKLGKDDADQPVGRYCLEVTEGAPLEGKVVNLLESPKLEEAVTGKVTKAKVTLKATSYLMENFFYIDSLTPVENGEIPTRETKLKIPCSASSVDYFPNRVLSSW